MEKKQSTESQGFDVLKLAPIYRAVGKLNLTEALMLQTYLAQQISDLQKKEK